MTIQTQIYQENLGLTLCGLQDTMMENGCGFNDLSLILLQTEQAQEFLLHFQNQQQINQFRVSENSLLFPPSKNQISITTTSNNGNTNLLSSMPISQSMASEFDKQRREMDRRISLEDVRIKLALQEQRKQQLASYLRKLEAKAAILLKQKDEEIAKAAKRTAELEDLMKKMEDEHQSWQRAATEKEAMIASLNTTLEQWRSADDAESFCAGRGTAEKNRGDEAGESAAFGGERKMSQPNFKILRTLSLFVCGLSEALRMAMDYEPLREDVGDEEQQRLRPIVAKTRSPRVVSLDVFRGLCVFLMMLVDYGGSVFPIIAHSPWNGVHLADFVMPFFLFVAGVALAIVYKNVTDRVDATWKAITRAIKLYFLGVFLQGGYLHGVNSMTYGVDIERIRWMGILQRISIAYVVTALCEIWLPCERWKRFGFLRRYFWQWCLALVLCSIYIGLLYGLYVPDWEFKVSEPNSSLPSSNSSYNYMVKCGVRGDFGPACNSAGLIDRHVLGINHLYVKPVYQNLKECNKSKDGIVPKDSPSWCHAPFDPEGTIGSLTAAVTCIIGLQFGHILVQLQDHKQRLFNWSQLSISLFILGLILTFFGIPLNKSLYTMSYTLVTSASAGFTFCASYLLVDVLGYRNLTFVLEWMGIHSLIIFILVTSNIAIIVIQGFYWRAPANNIVHLIISCFIHR
ncbi:hypothetical protein Nepgr_025496 [Nepenthes gracilis]|uniref:Heparan-alpha-glucosaminide N-acetyltransferase catalytic domain-containing protein n=1 Tax=Nepenthes gracilis TaxID=150966 RepID=A0AAD3XZR5_NEPGR|nr:hypothetical protein Nepgr_025496 [Nepenthes gracilis]